MHDGFLIKKSVIDTVIMSHKTNLSNNDFSYNVYLWLQVFVFILVPPSYLFLNVLNNMCCIINKLLRIVVLINQYYSQCSGIFNLPLLETSVVLWAWSLFCKCLHMFYTKHKTNEEVLDMLSREKQLLSNIVKRKCQYFGHLIRQNE